MNRPADPPRIATRARSRSWIAFCALVALTWPSLGPLPWVAAAHDALEAQHEHRHAHAHERHADGSDIPGSPTHPVDHHCAQCEVLKHLSRCAMPLLAPPAIAQQPACPVAAIAFDDSERAGHVATLPPVRAPPLPTA